MAYGPYLALVLDWTDGDTAHVDIDLGFSQRVAAYDLSGKPQMSCRILGINAPELATPGGPPALAYAEELCPPGTLVTLVSHSWDKYGGRFNGSITLPGGRDFAAAMLEAGHAVPYP